MHQLMGFYYFIGISICSVSNTPLICLFLISVFNYQALFLELRKLEKLAEGNIEMEWLMEFFQALMEARFAWSKNNKDIWTTSEDDLIVQHPVNFKQVYIYIYIYIYISTSLYG